MTTTVESELLLDLPPDAARSVLLLGTPATLEAGTVLFDLGGDADRLFLIRRGRIALTLPMKVEGRVADVLVEEKVGGEVVGWSAIIPPHRFTLKAAATVETSILAIPREPLLSLLEAEPTLGYALTRSVARIMGQRLQLFQAMWLRQMQRLLEANPAGEWSGR
ncbi:MAG: cyclic nucleotide-binding domain-containing protein [Acidobacteria bacterium]|nr:MAG: cyclic nucleotide-binding domain-containing protein [Acidobacteriota bacterium]